MKIFLHCLPCFARQAVESAEMATDDPEMKERIIRAALRKASEIPFDKSPPHMGKEIHKIIKDFLGDIDPYKDLKNLYNKEALDLYPRMKEIVASSDEPLETAARLAIAGNIIDFGVSVTDNHFRLMDIIEDTLKRPFAVDQYQEFKLDVRNAEKILYAGDNAGEIVFDRILIEEIPEFKQKVIYAVKGSAVLNDVTIDDARDTGVAEIVDVIENGSNAPGTILEDCSEQFLNTYNEADIVIGKGQGNYETLSEFCEKCYYLLKVKCPVLARDLKVGVGDIVLKKQEPFA
jgi:uncharacterized protein with ATP-grasp and redox domains